jgi:hypothetical protein
LLDEIEGWVGLGHDGLIGVCSLWGNDISMTNTLSKMLISTAWNIQPNSSYPLYE